MFHDSILQAGGRTQLRHESLPAPREDVNAPNTLGAFELADDLGTELQALLFLGVGVAGGRRGNRDPKRDLFAFGNPTLWLPTIIRAGTGACPYNVIARCGSQI